MKLKVGKFLLRKLSKKIRQKSTKSVFSGTKSSTKQKLQLKSASVRKTEKVSEQQLIASDLFRPNEQFQRSIAAFLQDQRSEHTKKAYGKDLKRFIKYLVYISNQNTRVIVDRALVIAYKDHLVSEKLQHTTIDRHLATLKSFFQWLKDDGVIQNNPTEAVRFLNPKKQSTTIGFTDVEVVQVLKQPNLHTRSGAMHYCILMLLFYCGLRRSEVCSIRTKNIGFERDQYFIRLTGKGSKERIVVLTLPVWNAIKHYSEIANINLSKDQPLFVAIKNNRTKIYTAPIDASMIYYIVTKYSKLAGIKNKVSPHSCRATAISNARDHQVPDRAIQEFAGWSTPNMITKYDKRKTVFEKAAAHAISYGAQDRTPKVSDTLALLVKK